jgi:hypothetical protein
MKQLPIFTGEMAGNPELDEIAVVVTRNELMALANGLNEALSAIDAWEFELRVGVSSDVAIGLIDEVQVVLRNTFRPSD